MDGVKQKIQEEALTRWEFAGRRGLLAIATGVGKSRIPLLRLEELYEEYGENLRVLLAVPTIELRDVTWPDEAKKWELGEVFKEQVEGYCYKSLDVKPKGHYHLVILDEAHHLTLKNGKFTENITFNEVMALTATPPEKGSENERLLSMIAPTVFTFNLDEGVESDVVADYEVYVVELPLNDTAKIIRAGNKKNRFYQTEAAAYKYLQGNIIKMLMSDKENKEKIVNSLFRKRAKFIYDLPSKQVMAKLLIDKVVGDQKTLVFGASIDQIEALLNPYTYHSSTDKDALQYFMEDKIQILGAVNALDEGVNLPMMDQIIIVQTNSKTRQITQRFGRVLRKREGHKARIYLLVATGTEDEKWAKKALADIDPSKIVYLSYKNFLDERL